MTDAVLVVDDDEDLREVMRETFERLGVQHVVTAASLRDVQVQRDQALGCQLAILDINLGHGQPSGVAVYEWLQREHFAGRIMFLTGHATDDPRVQEAAQLAGSRIASKPLSLAELERLLASGSRA